jgi:GMP synthase-like glutamine amidotransferase
MKPLRFFRHVVCETPGYLGTFLERRGCPYEVVCLDEGKPVPQDLDDVSGLVFMGGPGNVNEPTAWMAQELGLIRRAADRGLPVLGICLGAQLISKALGGEVWPAETLEVGWHAVEPITDAAGPGWFAGLPSRFEVFQWHAHTFSLPLGAVALARGACAEQQAFAIGNILAMQFHLEMTPESIEGLVRRYTGDLEGASDCVQDAATITADLSARTARLYRIADVVFGRWMERL